MKIHWRFLLWLWLTMNFLPQAISIKWLSLKNGIPEYGQGRCSMSRELGVSPCAALGPLAAAARLTKDACRALCRHRRWDCKAIDLAPNFTPDLLLGTKEQSFVYSLSSAALMHTMARACAAGVLSSCTCGRPPNKGPGRGFKWGGCSDNLRWAGRFVRQFIELPEKMEGFTRPSEKVHKEIRIYDTADRRVDSDGNVIETTTEIDPTSSVNEKTNTTTRILYDTTNKPYLDIHTRVVNADNDEHMIDEIFNVRNNLKEAAKQARLVKREIKTRRKWKRKGARRPKKAFNTKETLEEKLERLQPYIALANMQNSKVGRKTVERALRTECKCHGVSGSCSIRTCWRALPPFSAIGSALLLGSSLAARVRPARPPRHYMVAGAGRGRSRSGELLYVSPSPDYCRKDPATGSEGTEGRWCNASLSHGESSCRWLCCGRGYQTRSSSHLERCHCKYIWCCRVECQLCKITTDTHYCN